MQLKWQWFIGGKSMFWMTLVLFTILAVSFIFTYVIDPVATLYIKRRNTNVLSIKEISERYVRRLWN